ncbi:MAG: 4-hydroxybenzoate transporter PcaK [Alphaproteobacteria bacterium ADurb.BinA305]|nr:MAG: 4-hydroxybenzoate transporter PcaK [Alphaproteobacteria bacterium ADurb.BinA305]
MARKRRSTIIWVIALAFVGLVFDGYDLVVYGAVLPGFMGPDSAKWIGDHALTPKDAGMLGSYAMIGMMLGALVAGTLGDLIGRRKVMIGAIAWFSIGMAVSAMTETLAAFGVWRFITGLGVGALAGTTGAMAAEFAPPGKKNLATAFTYAGIPLGSLLSALLAIFLLPIIGWRGMFLIGALPLVTLLPLAIWKLPESVAWLASRGRLDEARKVSERTGVPIPEAEIKPQQSAAANASDARAGWAGLFTVYLVPAIVIGFVSAFCLLLVYSLNTWLPKIMLPIMGQNGSLALLLVLNAGAMVGTLYGSTLADKHSPQRIVALGFLVGALAMGAIGMIASTIDVPMVAKAGEIQQLADVSGIVVALLLLTIAITGLGTSGTQTLIYGLAANYYRTNVRGAGVAWTAAFGRIGGIFGPIFGAFLAVTFAGELHSIFYVLGGISLIGLALTLIIPKSKAAAAVQAGKSRLYGTIMAVVDHTGNRLTRERVSEFVSLTGSKVHLVYLAPEHVLSAEVDQTDKAIDPAHVANLQEYVNEVNAQGVPAEGQILTSTLFGRGRAVVDLAEQLRCDLIILNTEEGGQRAKAELAQEVAGQNPKMAVLIARSTQ